MSVDREKQAVILAAVAKPLERRHSRKRILSKPAELFGDRQPLDAEGSAFFPSLVIENGVAIVFDHVVIELLAGKAVDRAQQLSLLFRPGKIHAMSFLLLGLNALLPSRTD